MLKVKRTTCSFLYSPSISIYSPGVLHTTIGAHPFIFFVTPMSETSKPNTADDIIGKSRSLLVARQRWGTRRLSMFDYYPSRHGSHHVGPGGPGPGVRWSPFERCQGSGHSGWVRVGSSSSLLRSVVSLTHFHTFGCRCPVYLGPL